MARYIIMVAILLMTLPLQSQQTNDPLSLYNVNGWSLDLVTPPPNNVFDSVNTGMQIVPLEGSTTDSVQLFKMYGNTRRSGNEWKINFIWKRDQLPNPEYRKPQYILVDLKTRSYVNLAYLLFGIIVRDTTNHVTSFTWNVPELNSNWQTFVFFGSGGLPFSQYIHHIKLMFFMYGPDSTYIGLEALLNDLRFVYIDTIGGNIVTDTVLVDPFQYTFPLGIVEQLPGIPDGFVLHQNYPNPFNPSTKIRYEILEPSDIRLVVYDLLGQQVAELVNEFQNTGIYEADFDASNLASGTYVCVLLTEKYVLRRKIILLK